jgi:hypothetical protein
MLFGQRRHRIDTGAGLHGLRLLLPADFLVSLVYRALDGPTLAGRGFRRFLIELLRGDCCGRVAVPAHEIPSI